LDIRGEPMLDVGAENLLFLIKDFIKHRPSSSDLTPIHISARALLDLANASQPSKRTISTQANVAHILALIGSLDDARSALHSAVSRFSRSKDAMDNNVLPAADDLLGAAIALGDLAIAREIVAMISNERMARRGVAPDYPGWTNQRAREVLANAEMKKEDPLAVIAKAQIKSNDVAEKIKRIHRMQLDKSRKSREASLAESLREIGQMESRGIEDENYLKRAVALAFLAAGDIASAETLVTEIGDASRFEVLIQLALASARKREAEKVHRLLGEAKQALPIEPDPTGQIHFRLETAIILLELGERKEGEAAIEKARAALERIADPMVKALMAAAIAANHWKLNQQKEATATLRQFGMGSFAELAFGLIQTAAFLSKHGYVEDAQTIVSRALREALAGPMDPMDLAYTYGEAARILIEP
jgi:hypothetical protein